MRGGAGRAGLPVRWAEAGWEIEQAYALRRAVFCAEQGIFAEDDRDAVDDAAQLCWWRCAATRPLAARPARAARWSAPCASMKASRVWYGSRLAVQASLPRHSRLGATLIRSAVSSAHALGCRRFLAHVQSQNVPLFRRLHWTTLAEETLLGWPHHLMEADLHHYPPCHAPYAGFVIDDGAHSTTGGRHERRHLADLLRASRGFGHKTDIAGLLARLQQALPAGAQAEARGILLGDDCAAIADGDSHLLFAIEGMVGDFLRAMPRFAGYSAVMVNVSDIYAMGGRPGGGGCHLERGHGAGRRESCAAWPLPLPLTACRWWAATATRAATAPSLPSRARADQLRRAPRAAPADGGRPARPLRGAYPYWNATTGVPGARLRADLELLPALAEDGLCAAAKDISMAGAVGTALMLMECSGVGGTIDLDALPIPPGVPLPRWLSAFPSYGFLLAVDAADAATVAARFHARGLACAEIGMLDASRRVTIAQAGERALLWDFGSEPFILPRPAAAGLPPAGIDAVPLEALNHARHVLPRPLARPARNAVLFALFRRERAPRGRRGLPLPEFTDRARSC